MCVPGSHGPRSSGSVITPTSFFSTVYAKEITG